MTAVAGYFRGLSEHLGEQWNRFWFTPRRADTLAILRIAVGCLALIWQLSFTPDLIRWFGPTGWLDVTLYRNWVLDPPPQLFSGRLSYLFTTSPQLLWVLHLSSTLVLLAMTLGVFTRITTLLSLGVVLAYVHRAPFIATYAEMMLAMLLAYLCLAPCGRSRSLDSMFRLKTPDAPGGWATVAQRLMQVHLTLAYILIVCTKIFSVVWWNGDALWWTLVQPSAQLIGHDTFRNEPVLLNLWTYGVLLSEVSMIVLPWHRWLRPLALVVSAFSWLSVGIATGDFALPLTMIVANLVFLNADGE
ncbi:MAG: hypothetical protein KDA92_00580 [Planctomycetales bacterium]|nr:hypothetical protein [Planctomycetales bacterium]MCA9169659.1 hypothetical protein [Planctomycetales bacterium]